MYSAGCIRCTSHAPLPLSRSSAPLDCFIVPDTSLHVLIDAIRLFWLPRTTPPTLLLAMYAERVKATRVNHDHTSISHSRFGIY